MDIFLITLRSVVIILIFLLPGFIFGKLKSVSEDSLKGLSKVLIYACQPCLQVYALMNAEYSNELLVKMMLSLAISLIVQALGMFILWLLLRKKYDSVFPRILTVGGILGNAGFFGLPLVESVFPGNLEILACASMFSVSLNVIIWTASACIMSGDKKYISIKKVFINPAMISFFIAMIIFCFRIKLPSIFTEPITSLGKMSTPLCMIILGIRLGMMSLKSTFGNVYGIMVAIVKLIAFPLLCFLMVYFIPIDANIKAMMLLLSCCPTASTTLSFAEIFNNGQECAADALIVSTIACIITIPLLSLLMNVI